ncbi:hypothetical protein HJD18_14350 [Thermoleophilia bacterium SCSIO 60948]|nr:hypothetical protein HJD18_14350 [Thermoleophilia bacterium SCSIO 60948]
MLRVTRAVLALTALAAVAVVLPGTAQAATKQTRIVFDNAIVIGQTPIRGGMGGGAEDFLITGHLRSADKCLGGRKMTMVAIRAGERRKVDTDRSSRAGAWAFRGRLNSSVDDLKITVKRSRAGGDTCGSDTLRLRSGPAGRSDLAE